MGYNHIMRQNFALVYQTVLDNPFFKKLDAFCTEIVSAHPETVLKSDNLTAIKEDVFISLLKRDD